MKTQMRHTIILALPKIDIPAKDQLKQFVFQLIESGAATVDYYGGELDHSFDDDLDPDHRHHFHDHTYLSFHFTAELDTASDKESALQLIKSLLETREILEVRQDTKDVDVYI
ncbi:MAG TPA: hypothetical protein VF676_02740 [Flavobacterium sp.]|jgi:hypothetical protein